MRFLNRTDAGRQLAARLAPLAGDDLIVLGLPRGGVPSRLQSVSTSLDSSLVLYAVASAVIGGTSLFGGHGKAINAVLGGLVIAAIYNGMGLLGMSAASQYIVMALVLLAAVTVDATARRSRTSSAGR